MQACGGWFDRKSDDDYRADWPVLKQGLLGGETGRSDFGTEMIGVRRTDRSRARKRRPAPDH